MEYNPQIHHRKSIRLKGYDYSQAGAYFITICCHNRHCVFGNIPVGAGFTPAHDDKTFKNAHDNGQSQGIAPTFMDAPEKATARDCPYVHGCTRFWGNRKGLPLQWF